MAKKDTFQRTAFRIDRAAEFFSEQELAKQTGFPIDWWPIYLLRELMDNAADAAENAGVNPVISIEVTAKGLEVRDNGPGISPEQVAASTDYTVRVSDKLLYNAPTRGKQGNALLTLFPAPYVTLGQTGDAVVIEARGVRHTIGVTFDEKLGKPIIARRTKQIPHVPGTLVRLLWPDIADSLEPDETEEGTWAGEAIGGMRGACDFLAAYAVFNPHLSINGHGPAWEVDRQALDPKWPKWRPDEATSPFWYTAEQLGRLVAGEYRASPDAPKSIRAFIAQFRGLSGSSKQKAICTAAGIASGETVADLFGKNNQVDPARITRLLAAMQAESKPLKPAHLGMIGRDHMKRGLCDLFDVSQRSVRYERATCTTDDGVPWVLEVAFGVSTKDDDQRNILAGVNWSPSLRQPFDDLNDVLAENFIESDDPVVVAVHLIHPDPTSTDRGKTRYILDSEIHERLVALVAKAAAVWRKMKAKAQREERRLSREQLVEQREGKKSEKHLIIDSAYEVIPAAYAEASGRRGLAHARQVMYSARSLIDAAGGRLWKKDKYFTQVLLPNFVAANPELTQDWDVIYDERGHFAEPHTDEMFGIGTLTVRKYTRGWTKSIDDSFEKAPALSTAITTHGPANRFKFALFVEKQGFNPLIERARIAERFDIAIFSTKGMSTTAARQLVEDLSAMGVTILVLHDFDKSGLGILHTLRNDTRRFHFKTPPKVINLGLRLIDVLAMDLASETVKYEVKASPAHTLRRYGATEDEIAFLVQKQSGVKLWEGRRVELNAMNSDVWVEFVERRLIEEGVAKLIPESEILQAAFAHTARTVRANSAIKGVWGEIQEWTPPAAPSDLIDRVRALLVKHPEISWDAALANVVQELVGVVKTDPPAGGVTKVPSD